MGQLYCATTLQLIQIRSRHRCMQLQAQQQTGLVMPLGHLWFGHITHQRMAEVIATLGGNLGQRNVVVRDFNCQVQIGKPRRCS